MKDLFGSSADNPDEEFILVRDDPAYKEQRDFLEYLWKQYEPYSDKHFADEIALQFHPRFWEMYLACTLMKQGYQLVSHASGPDICIRETGRRLWIEAAAPTGGKGRDAIEEPRLEPGIAKVFSVPEESIILRYRSTIEEKHRRYLYYRAQDVVKADEPYVIALNGYKVPFARPDNADLPYIAKAVLPFGEYSITIDRKSLKRVQEGYAYRPRIVKKTKGPVSTEVFLDSTYSGISGILFSGVNLWNRPAICGAEFKYLHHPTATNGLPMGWTKVGSEYWVEGDQLKSRSLSEGGRPVAQGDGL